MKKEIVPIPKAPTLPGKTINSTQTLGVIISSLKILTDSLKLVPANKLVISKEVWSIIIL